MELFVQIFVDVVGGSKVLDTEIAEAAFRPSDRASGRLSSAAGPARIWSEPAVCSSAGNVDLREAEDLDAEEWAAALPPAQRSDGGFWLDWRTPGRIQGSAAGGRSHQGAYGALEGSSQPISTDGPWLLRTALGRLTLVAMVAAGAIFVALMVWGVSSAVAPFAADWLSIPPSPADATTASPGAAAAISAAGT